MANGPAAGPGLPAQPLPGWLGPIVSITTQVGVPTVFAGILLWFVLTRVGGTLEQMRKNDEDRMRILAAMQDTIIATLNRQSDLFEKAMKEQTAQFVMAIKENIATNQGIAQQMREIAMQRRLQEKAP